MKRNTDGHRRAGARRSRGASRRRRSAPSARPSGFRSGFGLPVRRPCSLPGSLGSHPLRLIRADAVEGQEAGQRLLPPHQNIRGYHSIQPLRPSPAQAGSSRDRRTCHLRLSVFPSHNLAITCCSVLCYANRRTGCSRRNNFFKDRGPTRRRGNGGAHPNARGPVHPSLDVGG